MRLTTSMAAPSVRSPWVAAPTNARSGRTSASSTLGCPLRGDVTCGGPCIGDNGGKSVVHWAVFAWERESSSDASTLGFQVSSTWAALSNLSKRPAMACQERFFFGPLHAGSSPPLSCGQGQKRKSPMHVNTAHTTPFPQWQLRNQII